MILLYTLFQLGALRFSNYWHARRSIFGTEKYLLRMTLNEALRYDIVALEACMLCLLPKQDSSGRQILYMDPSRHTEDDYTSDSLVRNYKRYLVFELLCELLPRTHAVNSHHHATAPFYLVRNGGSCAARKYRREPWCDTDTLIQEYEHL